MPDDHGDLVIDELLRDLGSNSRVGGVVLCIEFQGDLLTRYRQALLVDLFDGEPCPVLLVLAKVRDLAGQWSGVADLDDGIRLRRGGKHRDCGNDWESVYPLGALHKSSMSV